MKNLMLCLGLLSASVVLSNCSGGGGEEKTLYGSWEFVQMLNDSTHKWEPYEEDFFFSVSGKCEEVEVELQHYGDLTDAEMAKDPKCFGNRDQLSFTEPRMGDSFEWKMDASKDTLLGTSKRHYESGIGVPEGGMDVVLQFKAARIQ